MRLPLTPDWALLSPKTKFVVAFSGGIDSTVLLWQMVLRFGPDACVAVYFDHGLRSEAVLSTERTVVRRTARALGVRLMVRQLPMRAYMRRYGTGKEVTGRCLRYSLLAHFKKILGCDAVVTAHHQDDGAESALMQLGSGALFGMQGMRPHTVWEKTCDVYHPMWKMTKMMIQEHFRDSGLLHSEDATNRDTVIRRNHVRHAVFPAAETALPQFSEKIVRFGEWMGTLSDYVAQRIPASLMSFSYREGLTVLSLSGFEGLHQIEKEWVARYWLMHIFPPGASRIKRPQLRFSEAHIHALMAVASQRQPRTSLPGNTSAFHAGNWLFFSVRGIVRSPITTSDQTLCVAEGETRFEGWGFILRIRSETHHVGADFPARWKKPWIACLSTDRLPESTKLLIRNRREGDRFYPLGLSRSLSLKRFLIHRKFPAQWRGHLPLFFLGSELVWVPFLGISDRFRIGQSEVISPPIVARKEPLWIFEVMPLDDRFRAIFNHYNGM